MAMSSTWFAPDDIATRNSDLSAHDTVESGSMKTRHKRYRHLVFPNVEQRKRDRKTCRQAENKKQGGKNTTDDERVEAVNTEKDATEKPQPDKLTEVVGIDSCAESTLNPPTTRKTCSNRFRDISEADLDKYAMSINTEKTQKQTSWAVKIFRGEDDNGLIWVVCVCVFMRVCTCA